MAKTVPASVELKAFACPVCGAFASQEWWEVYARSVDHTPHLVTREVLANIEDLIREADNDKLKETYEGILQEAKEDISGAPRLRQAVDKYVSRQLNNIHLSECFACKQVSIWRYDGVLYPAQTFEVEPNEDLTDEIKGDFKEALSVLDASPRSAAALLRLCLQKLCLQLGEAGDNLNVDIGALVKRGLDPRIQKSLDVVRVVGNNAVHPGTIDLSDNRSTAAKLFDLVNRIAFDMITHPREVEALYEATVPLGAKAQIARRDGVS